MRAVEAVFWGALFLSGVAQAATEPTSPFHPVPPSALPRIGMEGDLSSFKTALTRQIERCQQEDLNEATRFGDRVVTRREWCIDAGRSFLALAQHAPDFPTLMDRARNSFDWYQTEGNDDQGSVLFTSYCSALLEGSLTPTSTYNFPLYRRPADLVSVGEGAHAIWGRRLADGTIVPYWDRKTIDIDGILKNQGLEIAYTTDPYSAFVLQLEGSGVMVVHHPDGSLERRFINFAGKNGQPYVSIAKILKSEGVPPQYLSTDGIGKWFALHPEQEMPTLIQDPAYVFFQFADNGPYGSDHVILSPRHSIAIDPHFFPQGAVTLFNAKRDAGRQVDFTTLAVTQDTGTAIQGPGRVDIYWGAGPEAMHEASDILSTGALFVALPKQH